jgi:tRNA(fMet)-specific endonuclease VapC
MSRHLKVALDANICIAILNESSEAARRRIRYLAPSEFAVSSIVVFELYYGVSKSRRSEENLRVLRSFVSRTQVLHFSEEDAIEAGKLRVYLRQIGQPIGPYDLLIAAQAKARSLKLATNNVREFSRVPSLIVEDWLADF